MQPVEIAKRDNLRALSAEWTLNRYCRPDPKLYTLAATGPYFGGIDIIINYDFDPLFPWLVNKEQEKLRARADLQLGQNDIKYVKRIRIRLTGRKLYQGSIGQLTLARDSILRACPSYKKLPNIYQVVMIESADVDVEADILEGVSFNVGPLKARVRKQISKSEHGKNMLFAVAVRPL